MCKFTTHCLNSDYSTNTQHRAEKQHTVPLGKLQRHVLLVCTFELFSAATCSEFAFLLHPTFFKKIHIVGDFIEV